MNHLTVGVLAHVDAGKTTLSEGMLYHSGAIKALGRVDHQDAFLDHFSLERERGITIFSKQARLNLGNRQITLLDTPGHVDFSAEMERTLQVLDYAVLVVSGVDGVQGHTLTLWHLLERYKIPAFLFLNKMDLPGADRDSLMLELRRLLHPGCIDFTQPEDTLYEELALCDEAAMEQYLEHGSLSQQEIARLVAQRKVFPCYPGCALKLEGIGELCSSLVQYTLLPEYPEEFGAKIYKIARDAQGTRLTYLKVTGGTLKVKDLLRYQSKSSSSPGEEIFLEEKADQIRLYSGTKYTLAEEAPAGQICAVTGLSQTYPGQKLGAQSDTASPLLEPVLTYQVLLPEGCDLHTALRCLRELEEEDPQLQVVFEERLQEIHIKLMGEIQLEILGALIQERFHIPVKFGPGSILYKETITAPVEGVGHFEPLRHYAEVHLLLEPGEPGSGLHFASVCNEDLLAKNWQRLILTHLREKEHLGVLTGSPIADMSITLLTGRAHLKHTEGGDFRQATYRAVRQGLMRAHSRLLEPWYAFRIELPTEMLGRAMSDVQKMHGIFEPPETRENRSVFTGRAPVSTMRTYAVEVASYTSGRGKLLCTPIGYLPCHNEEEIVASAGYEPERDLDNTPDSVFCAHGAGFPVKWNQVEEYMHLPARKL